MSGITLKGMTWSHPRGYDPMVRIKSDVQINQFLSNIRLVIGKCVDVMPSHGEYVAKTCPAAA